MREGQSSSLQNRSIITVLEKVSVLHLMCEQPRYCVAGGALV